MASLDRTGFEEAVEGDYAGTKRFIAVDSVFTGVLGNFPCLPFSFLFVLFCFFPPHHE